jgi:hypothetical protein
MRAKTTVSKLLIVLALLSAVSIVAVLVARHRTAKNLAAKPPDSPALVEDPGRSAVQSTVQPEEYEVYSSLVREYVEGGAKLAVVTDETVSIPYVEPLQGFAQANAPTGPLSAEAQPPTLENYIAKNQAASLISRKLNLQIAYILIRDRQVETIFAKSVLGGWRRFYRKYPRSPGIISFSRVGFNRNMDEALGIYLEGMRGALRRG